MPHRNKTEAYMPANKNALIRYKTIDNCLRNKYRRWTLDDFVDACSDALYDMEGIVKGVSRRTIQGDFNLALDRIVSVEPIDLPFRENQKFHPDRFFEDLVGVTKNINTRPTKLTFVANRFQANYIKTKPIHASQQLIDENSETGDCTFTINVCLNYELYSVLMSYGNGVKVVSPRNAMQ